MKRLVYFHYEKYQWVESKGGTGFVNVPLTSSEVRNFKKEIKGLLEDPIGTAE